VGQWQNKERKAKMVEQGEMGGVMAELRSSRMKARSTK